MGQDLTISIRRCSFSCADKKTNQKKPPAPRGPSGCPALLAAGEPCGTRFAQTATGLFSPAAAMLGPGQWVIKRRTAIND